MQKFESSLGGDSSVVSSIPACSAAESTPDKVGWGGSLFRGMMAWENSLPRGIMGWKWSLPSGTVAKAHKGLSAFYASMLVFMCT